MGRFLLVDVSERLMHLDELSAFLRSGDWGVGFDAHRLEVGKKLSRKASFEGLEGLRLEGGDVELVARLGDGVGYYEVVLGLWAECNELRVEGSCSCEFGTNCEHAAACLIWLTKGDRFRALFEARVREGDGSELRAWAEGFLRAGSVSESVAGDCLVYVLEESHGGGLLRLLRGRLLKSGALGRQLLSLGEVKIEELERPDDRVILEELALRSDSIRGPWLVQGMGFELLLKRIALTGRLVLNPQTMQVAAVGEAREGRLDWRLDETGRRPSVVVEPAADYALVAGGVWYVDGQSGQIGRVVISESRERVRQWLKGPEMDGERWRELQEWVRGKGVAFPGIEESGEAAKEGGAQPMAGKLRFRVELGGGYQPKLFGRALVIYGRHEFPLSAAEHRRVRRMKTEQDGWVVLPRDRELEDRGLRELRALGLESGVSQEDPLWHPLVPDGERDEAAWCQRYWTRFRHELGGLLEDRGWELRYAPGVGCEALHFKAEAWKAEIVEEGRGWFHLSAGFEVDGQSFELQPVLAALLEGSFYELTEGMAEGSEFLFFLPDGRALVLPVGRFRRLLNRLQGLMEFRWTPGHPLRLHKNELPLVVDDALKPEGVEDFGDFLTCLGEGGACPPQVPAPEGLVATLRSYQQTGFEWMQWLASEGLNGILADDMGLGKTLQTLAHLLKEKESGRSGGRPNLVLAPTSVVSNWQREAAKFAPGLEVLILQGSERHGQFSQVPKADLVLSSYALVSRDLEQLTEHEFHFLVLDEAQHIKNRDAHVSDAVRRIRSGHRLCLSGTPVENHLGELWALMDFLNPGLLGTREAFTSHFRTPIEKEGREGRQAELNQLVGPLILRREKRQVATELPPKTEMTHRIEMSESQKELYETVRATMDKRVRQALAAMGGGQAQVVFLDALLKLRQICCHPQLFESTHAAPSGKFDYFRELLGTLLDEGHRCLVFSQFTSMLAKIEKMLDQLEVPYLILTGETKDRQSLVERFQAGEGKVFLISLKAGGTGLTLTGADTVIHYDPWWNPAAENQATDRAYRIGQEKAVMVHKLICQNTVEERIQQMQVKKGDLALGLLDGVNV